MDGKVGVRAIEAVGVSENTGVDDGISKGVDPGVGIGVNEDDGTGVEAGVNVGEDVDVGEGVTAGEEVRVGAGSTLPARTNIVKWYTRAETVLAPVSIVLGKACHSDPSQ